ncbi:hypothetical protein V6N12_069081 [Hibiscus sabdariffa]|uniref:Uncharacterized protein n=1 Tax=Hibiscus sabdariffa TaxID=183260 RepID=A0ABR2FCY4_9ROSI
MLAKLPRSFGPQGEASNMQSKWVYFKVEAWFYRGRVGVIKNREKHKGSFETIHVQDVDGHEFAARLGNVFIIEKGI